MSRFKNGQIPASLLVEVGPYHWMPAATAKRWANLVADILKHEGVRMLITPGKNAYRDYAGQVFARTNACRNGRCIDAAVPGTSSHGGEYRGRDSLAIDVANWGVLGKTKWYAYCRKHGFEPGFFDWEPWHIIDWYPWTMPAGPSGGGTSKPSKPSKPATPEQEEDDDMTRNSAVWYKTNDKTYIYMIFNTASGFVHEVGNGANRGTLPGPYTAGLKASFDCPAWTSITLGHANVLKAALAAVRPKDAPTQLEVQIVSDEELASLEGEEYA